MNKTTSVNDKHSKTFPTLVPKTWAIASENRQKTQEKDDGSEGKLKADVKDDIRTKVSDDQRKMDSCTHVQKTWEVATKSQRETQEMEDGNKGKDQDGVHNKEVEQILERDDDGHVGHVDLKDVIMTSIEEENGCEAHEIEEAATKKDMKEVAMDDTTKEVDQRHMEYSMLVPETQSGDKGKVIVGVHYKDAEQRTMMAKRAKRI